MANETEFWETDKTKKSESKPEQQFEAIGDDEMVTMKVKGAKPIFNNPTEANITTVKFMRSIELTKDAKETPYTAFQMVVSYDVNGLDFYETYRGGRIYVNDGVQKTYIGPASAMGRVKALCISSKLDIGQAMSTWVEAMTGKKVLLKSETVMFGGKKFEKNMPISFVK